MSMPDSEAKKKWMKENLPMIGFKLHRKYDADILEFLESFGSEKQKVMKAAIREYMENHKEEN